MTSQQIELFLSVAKHLNFTKAAEENHSSQPTVSRQIALLEEELGVELFRRERGTVTLTVAGAVMSQELKKAKKGLYEALNRATSVQNNMAGKISLGFLSHLNTDMFVLPPTMAFSKQYSNVDIILESGGFSTLRKKLNEGACDVIFTYDFDMRAMENISYEKCYAVTHLFAMSSSHPLAQKDDLQLGDFSGQTFLTQRTSESNGRDSDINSICRQLGIEEPRLRTFDNIESMMFAVRMGQGIAMISSGMDCVFDSRYFCYTIPKTDVTTFIAAVWSLDNTNPVVPLFINALSENLAIDVFSV